MDDAPLVRSFKRLHDRFAMGRASSTRSRREQYVATGRRPRRVPWQAVTPLLPRGRRCRRLIFTDRLRGAARPRSDGFRTSSSTPLLTALSLDGQIRPSSVMPRSRCIPLARSTTLRVSRRSASCRPDSEPRQLDPAPTRNPIRDELNLGSCARALAVLTLITRPAFAAAQHGTDRNARTDPGSFLNTWNASPRRRGARWPLAGDARHPPGDPLPHPHRQPIHHADADSSRPGGPARSPPARK